MTEREKHGARRDVTRLAKKCNGFHRGDGEFKFEGSRAQEDMRKFVDGVAALKLFPCDDWALMTVLVVT